MKRLIGVTIVVALFSGCSLFGVFNQAETGLDLSERSEQQLKDAEAIIDSLVIDNMRYKEKLDSCQASKVGKQRTKSF
jgi:hypothetical protein